MNLYEELLKRDCVKEVTDEKAIKELNESKVRFYLGVDPTADSMHVGHLFGLINCKRLQLAGHEPVLIVGGCTGMIGDPSGRSSERTLLTEDIIKENVLGISKQIEKIITPYKMLNNYDWTHNINVIEFLRDIGKNFSINNMLAKDSVKSRLADGISYTEFSYQVIQAYDFLHLYEKEGVTMQVGGTEQWGNITAGTDLIRKHHGTEASAYGLVWPLITKSDGTKFGKSASGAVWLDKSKTSPYEFYQFWLNQTDEDAINYLYKYTFLSLEEIDNIKKEMEVNPHLRSAQKALAKDLTILVHTTEDYEDALRISEALFSGKVSSLTKEEIKSVFSEYPTFELDNLNIVDALIETKLATSKREAREFVNNGAVQVNGEKVTDLEFTLTKEKAIDKTYSIVKRGKKLNALIKH